MPCARHEHSEIDPKGIGHGRFADFGSSRLLHEFKRVAEAGEATKMSIILAVRVVTMGRAEQPVETQLWVAGWDDRQGHSGGSQALRGDREEERGNRFLVVREIGETVGEIIPAGEMRP
jgi:hypothetical protein